MPQPASNVLEDARKALQKRQLHVWLGAHPIKAEVAPRAPDWTVVLLLDVSHEEASYIVDELIKACLEPSKQVR